jgi:CRP-like cAMP-binding protein
MDHSVAALNGCQIAVISHQRLFDIIEKYPRLALAFWSDSMRSALCAHRPSVVRAMDPSRGDRHDPRRDVRAANHSNRPPDATGLSLVHVNRTLQKIRVDGLITFRHNLVTVLDPQRLQAVAQFNPTYLAAAPHTSRRRTPNSLEMLADVFLPGAQGRT